MSVFWASQANTIPLTFWALALCLANSDVKEQCKAEARSGAFVPDKDGKYDTKTLPYINAVIKEVLRHKVANIVHNKIVQPFALAATTKCVDNKKKTQYYPISKGDMATVCSYLQHHDTAYYKDPYEFRPERWLDNSKRPYNSYFPFGGGPNMCSGKFLALQEIATLVALFFREFDAELMDDIPEENWDNVVAVVGPKAPFSCRVKYARIIM
jgi:cytochrome P450